MPTENELVTTIREVLFLVKQSGRTPGTTDIANAIVAEFAARGDKRSLAEVCSLVRQEAAAAGTVMAGRGGRQ